MEDGGIVDEGEVIAGSLVALPFPAWNTASAVLFDGFYGLPLLVLPDHVLKEGLAEVYRPVYLRDVS
jgi:hypothetical protein